MNSKLMFYFDIRNDNSVSLQSEKQIRSLVDNLLLYKALFNETVHIFHEVKYSPRPTDEFDFNHATPSNEYVPMSDISTKFDEIPAELDFSDVKNIAYKIIMSRKTWFGKNNLEKEYDLFKKMYATYRKQNEKECDNLAVMIMDYVKREQNLLKLSAGKYQIIYHSELSAYEKKVRALIDNDWSGIIANWNNKELSSRALCLYANYFKIQAGINSTKAKILLCEKFDIDKEYADGLYKEIISEFVNNPELLNSCFTSLR